MKKIYNAPVARIINSGMEDAVLQATSSMGISETPVPGKGAGQEMSNDVKAQSASNFEW